jgi:hypothetical protein
MNGVHHYFTVCDQLSDEQKLQELTQKTLDLPRMYQLDQPVRDNISHFILRLAYAYQATEQEKKWFIRGEGQLLKLRLSKMTENKKRISENDFLDCMPDMFNFLKTNKIFPGEYEYIRKGSDKVSKRAKTELVSSHTV